MITGPNWVCRSMLHLLAGLVALAASDLDPSLQAQPRDPGGAENSISSGLVFLARQQADNGSFPGGSGSDRPGNSAAISDANQQVQVTAIALLSFLSAGHAQDVGRYDLTMRHAIDFLNQVIKEENERGTISATTRSMATVALTEAYGVELDARQRSQIRSAIDGAVERITKDSSPDDADHALALLWRALALRSARKLGLDVAQSRFDEILRRIGDSYQQAAGGFAPRAGSEVSALSTGSAVIVLALLDSPSRPEITVSMRTLNEAAHAKTSPARTPGELFMMVQAGALAGDGPAAQSIWQSASQQLISDQSFDGGWPEGHGRDEPGGRVYSTSAAILTLTVPMNVMTTFQP